MCHIVFCPESWFFLGKIEFMYIMAILLGTLFFLLLVTQMSNQTCRHGQDDLPMFKLSIWTKRWFKWLLKWHGCWCHRVHVLVFRALLLYWRILRTSTLCDMLSNIHTSLKSNWLACRPEQRGIEVVMLSSWYRLKYLRNVSRTLLNLCNGKLRELCR